MATMPFRCKVCNDEADNAYLKYYKKEGMNFIRDEKTDDYICPYCLKNYYCKNEHGEFEEIITESGNLST